MARKEEKESRAYVEFRYNLHTMVFRKIRFAEKLKNGWKPSERNIAVMAGQLKNRGVQKGYVDVDRAIDEVLEMFSGNGKKSVLKTGKKSVKAEKSVKKKVQ